MVHGKKLEHIRQHGACGSDGMIQVGTTKTIIQNEQQFAVELLDRGPPKRLFGIEIFGQVAVLQSSFLRNRSGSGSLVAVGRKYLDRCVENRAAIGNRGGTGSTFVC